MTSHYDVIIVGGGVTGTAILYALSKYSTVNNIALIEKYPKLAQVNSAKNNNSQTLHFGDIETNYGCEKAKKVKKAADLVASYVDNHKKEHLHKKFPKMVLAVGDDEAEKLEHRYEEFKTVYPHLKKIGKKEIAKIEPNVVKGRNPGEKLLALYSTDGYAIDYGKLSQSFAKEAVKTKTKTDLFLSTEVKKIEKQGNRYIVRTNRDTYSATVVLTAAAGHSLSFAYSLGYGKQFILLPVAGSFFCASKALNGKVYTLQRKRLPFAAVHGDPDVGNPNETRFGPTAKVIPFLERYHYGSVLDFFKLFEFRIDAVLSIINILSDKIVLKYILKNMLYDIPFIGKIAFMHNIRKIVPSLKLRDVTYGKGLGGIRPQVVDTHTKSMSFGEAQIMGDNIIFNITPSPGASTCLQTAEDDAQTIVRMLGKKYKFDIKRFRKEHKR
jgi:malate dehydrogenase (quinone)